MDIDKKKEIVSLMLNKGVLVDKECLEKLDNIQNIDRFHNFLSSSVISDEKKNFSDVLSSYRNHLLERATTSVNIGSTNIVPDDSVLRAPDNLSMKTEEYPDDLKATVKITFSYEGKPKKRTVQDFTGLFTARYKSLRNVLQGRKELSSLTSINRLSQKQQREQIALIGLVSDKQITKTGKVVLTLEDLTGTIKVIVSENASGFDTAKEIVHDEVIGITGTCSGTVIFANNIILPDIPIFHELKKSPDEVYALFLGDFHFGSKLFLDEPFEKLISWISGEQGNERQKEIARKVKYIFIAGDLVEGVGIYPNQENDLVIPDIYDQYKELAKHLRRIPEDKHLIICPGNHDAMRIAEPQPPLYEDFAEAVWKLPNSHLVSSPSYINIHSSDKFPGFEVLLYHGFSFIYYADQVESIREAGGQRRSDLIMKFLLQRRHLAPAHKSTLYLPDNDKDSLVVDKIPDFFVSGHIHRTSAATYRNVTLLNCSSWLTMSDYQEKVGLIPQPGRAILVNLQTRKPKILKFYDDEKLQEADQEVEQKVKEEIAKNG